MKQEMELFEPTKKSVNIVIVVVTVAIFFVLQFWEKSVTSGEFYGHTTQFLLEHGALHRNSILDGEWYRLITYQFLHGDIWHLGNNMLVLFCLGNALEHYLGPVMYGMLYFFSGILAGLGSVVYNTDSPVGVGASGAVFGVVGAMLWLFVCNRGRLQGLTGTRMLLFVVLGIYGGLINQGVDNVAHIVGLIAGFMLAILFYRKQRETETEVTP